MTCLNSSSPSVQSTGNLYVFHTSPRKLAIHPTHDNKKSAFQNRSDERKLKRQRKRMTKRTISHTHTQIIHNLPIHKRLPNRALSRPIVPPMPMPSFPPLRIPPFLPIPILPRPSRPTRRIMIMFQKMSHEELALALCAQHAPESERVEETPGEGVGCVNDDGRRWRGRGRGEEEEEEGSVGEEEDEHEVCCAV